MRTIAALFMMSGGAIAAPADALNDEIAKCWNIPAGSADATIDMTFDVLIGQSGSVADITVVEFAETGDLGEAIVRSGSAAIERCAPYKDLPEGVVRVRMKWEPGAPIDPFKK